MLFNKVHIDYNSIVLHSHVPKSGGTTVRETLSQYFKPNQILWIAEPGTNHYYSNQINAPIPVNEKNYLKKWLISNFSIINTIIKFKNITKNFLKGEDFIFRDFNYLTTDEKNKLRFIISNLERINVPTILGKHYLKTLIIRDPVSRLQSYYFEAQVNEKGKKPYQLKAKKYHINDFIKYLYDERPYMVNNPNCICVSGTKDFFITKQIIDNEFFLCAPIEKLNEFLELLSLKLFSVSNEIRNRNISKSNPKKIIISDNLVDRIISSNQADIELKKHIELEFDKVLNSYN